MACLDRKGCPVGEDKAQGMILRFLYRNAAGRLLLKPLIAPPVSRLAKKVLESRPSSLFVNGFIRKNGIDMSDYGEVSYPSFNAFFTRKILPEKRPFAREAEAFCSPCDSRLSVYPIEHNAHFSIKGIPYTMEEFTKSKSLADRFAGGWLLLFRLTVKDYHHYACVDDGTLGKSHYYPGVLHTVNPVAVESVPVYRQNARCLTLFKSDHFGTLLCAEVGAMMVGEIVNVKERARVVRGEEKGYFSFGGSTVIVCVQKDRLAIDEDILENSRRGVETLVRMGEKIGVKA